MSTYGFSHHGVLAHQDHSLFPKRKANGLHLLGADIVRTHNEAFWIIVQKFLKLKKGKMLVFGRGRLKPTTRFSIFNNNTYARRTNVR